MGKRKKSSRGPVAKKKEMLNQVFKCVFCNSENAVSAKIDKKAGVASLSCKNCSQTYQTTANYLTAPVDVYFDWVDACESVRDTGGDAAPARSQAAMSRFTQPKSREGLAPGEKVTAEDAGFIDDEGAEDEEADFVDDE